MKMKNKIIYTLIICTITYLLNISAQINNYSDVLIVINNNSVISDSVGSYFASQRNIPSENIARISASTSEEIDSTAFNSIRQQIENHITSHSLTTSINYIVTTKGLPLKVNRGNTFSTSSPSSSLESELTLILSAQSGQIGKNGYTISPYFLSTEKFSKSAFDMYLVTRLDGYSFHDVKTLIDKSSSTVYVDTSYQFVLDQDPTWNSSIPYLNNAMLYAATKLNAKGIKTNLDKTNTFLTNQTNVMGYTSWGSNDNNANQYTQYGKPHNSWIPGAIAETYVSTSGRTFDDPVIYGQSVVADLISEGATGVKGYVYEPFSNAMAVVWVLFDRYTDGFNLAESYYASSRALSWMDVIVGDPKMKVTLQKPTSDQSLPIQLASFTANIVSKKVTLEWNTISEINNYGFDVERYDDNSESYDKICFVAGNGTTLEPAAYQFIDENIPQGALQYRLKQIDNNGLSHYFGPISIDPNSVDDKENKLSSISLLQNYPNPFNPSTEITFNLNQNGKVVLRIFNSIGEEVSKVLNEELNAGTHKIKFDGTLLSSGIYYSVLETNNGISVNKMSLVK
jgi:uncharacterized protein (TIGR03790 family)